MSNYKKAITTTKAAIVIVVILVVVAAGAYFATSTSTPSVSTSSATSSAMSSAMSQTLVIDDANWPVHNLNALYQFIYVPWPWWLEHTVYQTLVVPDLNAEFGQGKLVWAPDLATDWNVSADSTTYTYNLRQNVAFSSGNPFNAYQVWTEMYIWYYFGGNATSFLGGLDLFDVSHVNFGPASFDLLKGQLANPTGAALAMMTDSSWPIYTTGPYQIVFHTKKPFLYLNGIMAGFEGLLFDCQWGLDHGGFGTPAVYNPYFDDHPMPGTGPYTVTEVLLNSHVRFEKNPTYWGNSLTADQIAANPVLNPGQAATVVMYAKSDDLARFTDLSTGAAQIAAIRTSNWNRVINDPKYAYWTVQTTAELTALAMNTAIAPTNNVDVRQAIVHGINYTQIWDQAYFGKANALMGPETPNYGQYYDPGNLPPYDFNPTLAAQYLVKAGYPNGTGLPTLTLRTVADCAICTTAAEIIQGNLANIGINVQITTLQGSTYWAPYGSYTTNLQNAQQLAQLSFLGGQFWAPSALTPTDYWTSFVSNRSLWGNWAVYTNPTVEKAITLLANSGSETDILTSLTAAQQQIYNDAPYAWIGTCSLWYVDGSFAWDKSVIKSVLFDPAYTGINTAPLFNTVVFA